MLNSFVFILKDLGFLTFKTREQDRTHIRNVVHRAITVPVGYDMVFLNRIIFYVLNFL